MKLSNRKSTELYSTVHGDILDARIQIAKLLQDYKATGEAVDKVLYELGLSAPRKALEVFKPKNT